jgi:Protein of unknown function (DUF3987)
MDAGGFGAKAPPPPPPSDPELDDDIPEQKPPQPGRDPDLDLGDSDLDDDGLDDDELDDDEPVEQQRQRETKPAWPVLDAAAYHGLAGAAVNTITSHSEADPVALLIQFLAVAGNIIGRRFYYQVESDRHHPNLSVVLVGQSSKARKGTSFGRISAIAKVGDLQWATDRIKGGLSSGEGLINEVRDEVKKWSAKEKDWEVVDPGVTDKRLMIVEPEFAGALAVMERHGNTLSPVLRKAWDGDRLATLTRGSSLVATGAHISVIGHITETELRARLTRTDAANGFANRFLFPLVRRSKELPFGGNLTDSEIRHIGDGLQEALTKLRTDVPRITMADDAKAVWARIYSDLSSDKPGMFGAVTARAEAQTVRLAMMYALLDGAVQIDSNHLNAGLAVWKYCEASARRIRRCYRRSGGGRDYQGLTECGRCRTD